MAAPVAEPRTTLTIDGDVQVVFTNAIPMPSSQPAAPAEALVSYQPLAYSLKVAAEVSGISQRRLSDAITSGELRARKNGVKHLITRDDLRAYIESLPLAVEGVV